MKNIDSVQLIIARTLKPYQRTLQNARWPAQRYEYILQQADSIRPAHQSDIESHMLQLSFGYDYPYFMLRSMLGKTYVEINRGNLTKHKSIVEIYNSKDFYGIESGVFYRPCNVAGETFLCVVDIPMIRDFVPINERIYSFIAVLPTDLIVSSKFTTWDDRFYLPRPYINLVINSSSYIILGNKKDKAILSNEAIIDNGFSIVGGYNTTAFIVSVFVSALIIYTIFLLIVLGLNQYITKRLNKKVEIVLMQNKLKHYEEIKTLVRGVKHDIKSPLSVLQMIAATEVSVEKNEMLSQLIKRMRKIIQDLDFKGRKIDVQDKVLLPLALLIKNSIQEKSKEIAQKIILNRSDLEQEVWVRAYYSELIRMFSNILNNASEASSSYSDIKITIKDQDEQYVQIQIHDFGKGIPAECLSKVFDKTFTCEKDSGTGFGLYHAKKTIESLGGTIYIESEVGHGTTVNINLKKELKPKWAVDKLSLKNKNKIVLIDDESVNERIWLEKLRKYNMEFKYYNHPKGVDLSQMRRGDVLLLFDNTFFNDHGLGLRFIDENKLQGCTLVSSDWELLEVQKAAERLKIGLLGKEFIQNIEVIQ
ncbi:MAG: HAMP domain-containing sensor histidine kinase [bacterium]